MSPSRPAQLLQSAAPHLISIPAERANATKSSAVRSSHPAASLGRARPGAPSGAAFRAATQLLRYRLHGCPLRTALLLVFLNQAYRPIPELFRVPRLSFLCSWPNPLKESSLRESRGGSGVAFVNAKGMTAYFVRLQRLVRRHLRFSTGCLRPLAVGLFQSWRLGCQPRVHKRYAPP